MERVVSDGESSDAGDGVAAGVVRPVQGDDLGEGVDEGGVDDARDGELRGGGGIEPGGCDQDEGDDYEGGGGGRRPPYGGALDCAIKTVRTEGLMALYKGFIPTIFRQGPFTVCCSLRLNRSGSCSKISKHIHSS